MKKLKLSACFAVALSLILSAGLCTANALTNYVSLSGSHEFPYTNWAMAATNIQDAVNAASDGDTVLVTNGIYSSRGSFTNVLAIASYSMVVVTNGITIISVNGADVTIVNGNYPTATNRCFFLSHSNAVLDGFTISNAYAIYNTQQTGWQIQGAGVYLGGGTIRNCIITSNTTAGSYNIRGYGAGVYMINGTVESSLIAGNYAGYDNMAGGGGVYITGGTLKKCTIKENTSRIDGGGVSLSGGGVLENCLIVSNHGDYRGGGVYMTGGGLRYCTVADNSVGVGNAISYVAASDGPGVYMTAGSLSNCIVYHNDSSPYLAKHKDVYRTDGTIAYSCVFPPMTGLNNIASDPQFADRATGNYRLLPGSPSIDTGTNIAGVTSDIDGNPRPVDGTGDGMAIADMGAYEADSVTGGVFRCNFIANPAGAADSLDTVLTAYVSGPDTNITYYGWDFDNNGTMDTEGADKRVVATQYSYGIYSVALTVSNQSAQVTNLTKDSYIIVAPTNAYVATNGAHAFPYHSWTNAATNIQTAIDAVWVSETNIPQVIVSNGTYRITNEIYLTQNISVRSVGGATNTIVQRSGSGSMHIFYVGASNAVLDGFTIRDAYWTTAYRFSINRLGGGVYLSAGTVQNCIITSNTVVGIYNWTACGAGVYMTGGSVQNSTIVSNQAIGVSFSSGGGVYATVSGMVQNCTITKNKAFTSGGGAFLGAGVTLRNCAISENFMTNGACNGGGVYCNSGGTLQNCTISDNIATNAGGGVAGAGGNVLNTIIYFNIATNGANWYTNGVGMSFTNCATTPTNYLPGAGNIDGDPLFVDTNVANYRLATGSPCINAGNNQAWMPGAVDLDGKARIIGSTVDIGAYEYEPPRGTQFTVY